MGKLSIRLNVFSLFLIGSIVCNGQSWIWGKQGMSHMKATSITNWVTTNKTGNAYVTGVYNSDVIFGNDTLKTNSFNAYLVKYDSSGNVIWAKQPLAKTSIFPEYNQGFSDAMDVAGNIYMAGILTDTVLFGATKLYDRDMSNADLFIAKYTPGGNTVWAKQSVHNTGGILNRCVVATDKTSGIYVTGTFSDSAMFGKDTLISMGQSNVFLVKYDTNGNLMWATQSKSNQYSSATAASVTTDHAGNIYVTGSLSDTVEFDKDTLKNGTLFLIKYNANGHVIWATESDTLFLVPQAITTDNSGNVYIAGYNSFYDNIFLAKYTNGGTLLWIKYSRNTEYWKATSLSSDANDHIYISGVGGPDTLDFDNIYYTWNYDPQSFPAFLLKLDTSGAPLCGTILWGGRDITGPEWVSCASDSSGRYIYLAGAFFDSLICGPDTLDFANDEGEPYLARWNACELGLGINDIKGESEMVKVYPNPSNGFFQLEIKNYELGINNIVEVYNILGEKVYSHQFLISNSQFLINLSNQSSGIYLYRVITETGDLIGEGKVVIQK